MAVDLEGIQTNWTKARASGTRMSQLARRAQVAYIKEDGTEVAPHIDTIASIKTEFVSLISDFEAALVAMKAAYTP